MMVGRLVTSMLALTLVACSAATAPGSADNSIAPSPTTAAAPVTGEPTDRTTPPRAELNTRLVDAAWDNDIERVRRLIDAGADVNATDDSQQSAYLIATSEGHLDLLELTLRHGADVRALDRFNGTGLIRAAERGHADVVGRLLQTDIDVDHINNLGWTALHEAIILGQYTQRYVDTVRLLVAGGADATLPSQRDGIAPLQLARDKNYYEVATTIEAATGRPDIDDSNAALLEAAAAGDADRAALAIREGADLDTPDSSGRTPLRHANANGHDAVARLLVALGAST